MSARNASYSARSVERSRRSTDSHAGSFTTAGCCTIVPSASLPAALALAQDQRASDMARAAALVRWFMSS